MMLPKLRVPPGSCVHPWGGSGANRRHVPLTALQEGLLAVTEQLSSACIAQHRFKLPHDVDNVKFKEAWIAVAGQMPILRTRFFPAGRIGTLQVVMKDGIKFTEHRDWHDHDIASHQQPTLGLE